MSEHEDLKEKNKALQSKLSTKKHRLKNLAAIISDFLEQTHEDETQDIIYKLSLAQMYASFWNDLKGTRTSTPERTRKHYCISFCNKSSLLSRYAVYFP